MNKAPKKGSLLVIFLTVFIDLLGFGMVLPLLPVYAKLFMHSDHQQNWMIGLLMSSFSAMQFLFAPVWGRASDRLGRRPMIMLGLAGSTVCYALFGVASIQRSLVLLFASRIGAGIFGATIPTAQAYIADVTTLETRARGMALIGAAFGLGFVFGPLLGAAALLGAHDNAAVSPWPGFVAAMLSASALALAFFQLPESLQPDSGPASRGLIDLAALRRAIATPTVAWLLAALFVCIVSFANLESTLSVLLKDQRAGFDYSFEQILLVYAFIGLTLTIAQGVLVRRASTRLSEEVMAAGGASVAVIGFGLLSWAIRSASLTQLLIALVVEVTGFAFFNPSLNALISRRSDPRQQGGILGVGQSIAALARIAGPMLAMNMFTLGPTVPFWVGGGLMLVALGMMAFTRGGRDFATAGEG